MQEVKLEAKTKEEALKKVSETLNANLNEIIYNIKEEKGHLFKSLTFKINATTLNEVEKEIKNFLSQVIENLGLKVMIETQLKERKIEVQMTSDNNQILIGKNGQTLKALEILCRQYFLNQYKYYINLNLDVENYKEQRIQNLEHLAKKMAKEVVSTKIKVKLENMNSFERRVIHNSLVNFEGITTISEGEEPNRHVIIKPIA